MAVTQVATADPRAGTLTPSRDPLEEADELRPVTALFADVVGSTSIGERLSPEEVKALIGECVSRMARSVEQFGGVVDAFMGDGVAAFFGVPVAHEDDPSAPPARRCTSSTWSASTRRDIEAAWGISDFNVRVGLNSGPVAVGLVGGAKRQSVALGDTPNVAARLQSAAEPGSVVVGEATARQLVGRFVFESLGDVSVKGREEPVSIFRLEPSDAQASTAVSPTPLVGRDDELERLDSSHGTTCSRGAGQVLLVLGDAGIGKTRLLAELRGLAGDSVTWLEGDCVSYGAEFRLLPMVEALRTGSGWRRARRRSPSARACGSSWSRCSATALERLLPYLESMLAGMGDETSALLESHAEDVRRACCAWIEALAVTMPVAFVFEDFQWADPWTCELATRPPAGRRARPAAARGELPHRALSRTVGASA